MVIPIMSIKLLKKTQKPKHQKNSTPKSPKPLKYTIPEHKLRLLSWLCCRLDADTVNQCTLGWNSMRVQPRLLPAPHHPPAQVLSPQPSCPGGLGSSQMWGRSPPANPFLFTTGSHWSSQAASLLSVLRLFETPSCSFELQKPKTNTPKNNLKKTQTQTKSSKQTHPPFP